MSDEIIANQYRVLALNTLDEARSKLHSWVFIAALRAGSQEQRDIAAKLMLDVALARQVLSSEVLSSIIEELNKEKSNIISAAKGLENAVKHLDSVKPVLDAITTIIGVVGRIVKLV